MPGPSDPKTKAILINNPQNPCGKVFTREELEFIGDLCEKYDAFAIGDEVYEHMVYDGREHVTLLSIPTLRDRCFVVSSTAKTFSMTGWKIGYVMAAPELTRAVRMSHQFIVFCGQSALQEAMAFAIDYPDSYYEGLLADYTHRRAMLLNTLREIGFTHMFRKAPTISWSISRPWGLATTWNSVVCSLKRRELRLFPVPFFGTTGGRGVILCAFVSARKRKP